MSPELQRREVFDLCPLLLEIFEAEGWDWGYHAYREWYGWSLEHEASDPKNVQQVGSTDRLELFKSYFAKNRAGTR